MIKLECMKTILGLLVPLIYAQIALAGSNADHAPDHPEVLKIAVLDTGFDVDSHTVARLCPTGHKDFSTDNTYVRGVPTDGSSFRHGTNIAGIIDRYARQGNQNYCIVVIKYWSEKMVNPLAAEIKAINYAHKINAAFLNVSGGGNNPSDKENAAVKSYLDDHGVFVAAAGNNGLNMDRDVQYFPAYSDPRVIVVGSLNEKGERSRFSNYGQRVTSWEIGEHVDGLTGTSQATAVRTGKLVSKYKNNSQLHIATK